MWVKYVGYKHTMELKVDDSSDSYSHTVRGVEFLQVNPLQAAIVTEYLWSLARAGTSRELSVTVSSSLPVALWTLTPTPSTSRV